MVQPLHREVGGEIVRSPSQLQRLWQRGGFALTVQLPPLLTMQPEEIIEQVTEHARQFDALLIGDAPGGAVALSALSLAVLFQRVNIETIVLLSGRDKNRLALQSDILSLGALKIPNVLVDTREIDRTSLHLHADARLVAELDGPALLSTAVGMRDGAHFISGAAIKTPPQFYLGALLDPEVHPPIENLEEAQFLVVTLQADVPRLVESLLMFAAVHAAFLLERPLMASIPLTFDPQREMGETADPSHAVNRQAIISAMNTLMRCEVVRGFNFIVPELAYLSELPYLAQASTSYCADQE